MLLLRKTLNGTVYRRCDREPVVDCFDVANCLMEHLTSYFPPGVIFTNDYVIGTLEDGITYFPFWGSWLLVIIEVGLVLYLIYIIRSIRWPHFSVVRN